MNKKVPTLFAHIPFYTLQAHTDGVRWCHIVENETVWFKRFGIKQNYNKKTGEKISGFDRDTSAHELLLLQKYTSLSSYYGIPEVISAIVAIMGNKYEADYNLQFLQPIKKVSSLPIRDLNIFQLFRRYKKGKSRS